MPAVKHIYRSCIMPIALWALAISAFAIGTTEFVIMGLLPEVAANLGTTLSSAGLLVTGYALGVFIGAPLVTWICSPVSSETFQTCALPVR